MHGRARQSVDCSVNSVIGECHDKRNSYRTGRAGAACDHRYGGVRSCCPVCNVGGLVRNADAREHTSAGSAQTERLCGEGCRRITSSRAICAHGTDSSGGLGNGTAVVALSAAEEGCSFRKSQSAAILAAAWNVRGRPRARHTRACRPPVGSPWAWQAPTDMFAETMRSHRSSA